MQIRFTGPKMKYVRWSEIKPGGFFLTFYGNEKQPGAEWYVKVGTHDFVRANTWDYFTARLPQYGLAIPLTADDVSRIQKSIPELSALLYVFSDVTYRRGRFIPGEEVPKAEQGG